MRLRALQNNILCILIYMTQKHFSFEEVFTFGWSKTKQHAWFIVLTFIIISTIISAVKEAFVINIVVALMVALSLASISLTISRGHSFTFNDLFTVFLSQNRVTKFVALSILYSLPALIAGSSFSFVVIGIYNQNPLFTLSALLVSTLLTIPAIYVTVRYKFFPFVVLEHENASLQDIIKMSYKLTTNHFWLLFAFLTCAAILNIVGAIFMFVGLLITVPTTLFATAHVYNKLKEHSV